jgi:DNA helicase II / ATP-dependent DNA helicase PcrA
MTWNDDLTGTPLEIAGSNSRNIRVVAGPGTGKTYSLKKRVTRLLEEGIDPRLILVVTFTRVAAQDLLFILD